MKKLLVLMLVLLLARIAPAQHLTEAIRLNQIGFYPQAAKVAVVTQPAAGQFMVVTPDFADTVYTGTLKAEMQSPLSGETVRLADFTPVQKPGTYVLYVPELGYSYAFNIGRDVHREVAQGAIKGFYFQRASIGLPAQYAGKWARPAGHPDDKVLIHPSAASDRRPAESTTSAPKGWYDAGDYNKYIVNSGITTATMLAIYEDFPELATSMKLNIPETGNALPDVLDEALWNIRWMLAMQDPADGGVYTKLTEAKFSGMVMPAEVTAPRYVVQKSTAAALNFAAVMAQAGRIFKEFNRAAPGVSDLCTTAALRAWKWARQNPDVLYDQNRMNEAFDPDVTTGGYGDRNVSDEFIWAATELYVTTRQDSFYTAVNLFPDKTAPLPTWNQVRTLGYYTLARAKDRLTITGRKDFERVSARLVAYADTLVRTAEASPYAIPMGQSRRDFVWGSNAVAANQGIALVQAYKLTGDKRYLQSALANLDYLLGRNGTAFCFLTGFGTKPPMNPHHRPSLGDGIREPIPGLLVGGPNPGKQDPCTYEFSEPMRAYVDDGCSYASNEIAINWNAPFAYLAMALEALQVEGGMVARK